MTRSVWGVAPKAPDCGSGTRPKKPSQTPFISKPPDFFWFSSEVSQWRFQRKSCEPWRTEVGGAVGFECPRRPQIDHPCRLRIDQCLSSGGGGQSQIGTASRSFCGSSVSRSSLFRPCSCHWMVMPSFLTVMRSTRVCRTLACSAGNNSSQTASIDCRVPTAWASSTLGRWLPTSRTACPCSPIA